MEASKTYTEEQRDLNGRCSVVMHVEDDFISNPRLLEDEIERQHLRADYMEALEDILGIDVYHGPNGFEGLSIDAEWALLRATPEQKARAFLAVVEPAP